MKEKFIEGIDQALEKIGYSDRSSFIRDAIAEKLRSEGINLPTELRLAPSRAGKGGRPRHASQQAEKSAASQAAEPTGPSKGRGKARQVKTKFRSPDESRPQAFGRNYSAK